MNITITTKVNVSQDRIASLLCTALDTGCGGSWYWIHDYKYTKATGAEYWHDIPLHGGSIEFDVRELEDDEPEWHTLDATTIEKGLKLMADTYPDYHWRNFITENDDAETGDVFLQLCLFGEVIYG
jgi:hypothetical protein